MRFSLIIPAFNAERFLHECLSSVEMQTFKDYELLLIDDGSTDETATIMDSYAADHDGVHVYHGPNEGPLLARRRGLAAAKGDYIVFLDADDCLRADALKIIEVSLLGTDADIVSFHCSRKADYSTADDTSALSEGLYVGERYELVKEHVCRGRFNNLWGKAYRSSCLDSEFDYSAFKGLMHGEDLFQILPIIGNSSSLCQLSEVLYYYRPNEESSTARYKTSQLNDAVIVGRRLNDFALAWDGGCIEAAGIGECNLYVYLLKMSELSDAISEDKQLAFSEIRKAMRQEGLFERVRDIKLRPDNRLILWALEKGNRSLARIIAILAEGIKGAAIGAGRRNRLERTINRLGFK